MVDISMAFPKAAAHYKSGILSSRVQLHAADTIDDLKHATVIVGWGQDKDIKYWILQNSYGESYGADGYFKVHRGHDIFHTESFGVAFEVDLVNRKSEFM